MANCTLAHSFASTSGKVQWSHSQHGLTIKINRSTIKTRIQYHQLRKHIVPHIICLIKVTIQQFQVIYNLCLAVSSHSHSRNVLYFYSAANNIFMLSHYEITITHVYVRIIFNICSYFIFLYLNNSQNNTNSNTAKNGESVNCSEQIIHLSPDGQVV